MARVMWWVGAGCGLILLGFVAQARSQVPANPVSFAPRELEILIGPLTRSGHRDELRDYDSLQLKRGRQYAEEFPASASIMESNFYDLALSLYQIYYRTNDMYWRDQARRVARAWRDAPSNQALDRYLRKDPSVPISLVPPARGMSTLGLAVLALEAKDAEARRIVKLHARLSDAWATVDFWGENNPTMPFIDPREAGFMLQARIAATVLGDDHRASAKRLLDAILAKQLPSGLWPSVQGTGLTVKPFMMALTMEALILYDRAIGDARIVPALKRAMDGLMVSHWVPSALSFKYMSPGLPEESDETPYATFNAMLLPAWGYVIHKTGRPLYRAQANEMLRGLVQKGPAELFSVKQFVQQFRSSSRYLGYIEFTRVPER